MRNKIANLVTWIIIIVILVIAFNFYKENNFNEFVRSEMNLHTSEFRRDNEVKYQNLNSYKIISNTKNDATFYKKVKVQKICHIKLHVWLKQKMSFQKMICQE